MLAEGGVARADHNLSTLNKTGDSFVLHASGAAAAILPLGVLSGKTEPRADLSYCPLV